MSLLAAALLCAAGIACAEPAPAPASVLRLEARGIISPPLSEHIRDGLRRAEADGDGAVLIELDTPGGLLDSTREIVEAMLNSPLPVIVYVAPDGARATSAGVFLTMAADAAAMAPGTHLGAAHPVEMGGKGPGGVMGEKAVSDAAAYVRMLAARNGRNARWAEDAVRKSVSLTAQEALARNVVDVVAPDRDALFRRLDGRELVKRGVPLRLSLANARVREFPMSPLRRALQVLANPNLALLFLVLGFYGLLYEFSTGGTGLGAAAAVACLILAAYAMSILPVNGAGLLLILGGFALLALELHASAHGLLAAGGLALLAFGAYILFDAAGFAGRVSPTAIASAVAATAAFFVFVVAKLIQARRLKPAVGAQTLIGRAVVVRETIDPEGLVFVDGELWLAQAPRRLEKGARATVVEVRGNVLRVEGAEEARHD